MATASLEDIQGLLQQAQEYKRTHALEFYEPYKFQQDFHFAKGVGSFVHAPSDVYGEGLAIHRALQCANQIGKSFCGGRETALHLTGLYPDSWKGHRFKHPVEWIVASTTNETTRDRCQRELLGEPSSDQMLGTGAIPKHLIGETPRKAGVPNAKEVALVKHVSGGWSKCYFKSYDQGPKKFMGYKINGAWCDEEPYMDIWTQILRGLLASDGIGYITYTPEEGVTEVVHHFMNDLGPGQALITATWDDAPHMTQERVAQKLASLPAHERDMRSKGIPKMGSGQIFPVADEDLQCDPFNIPDYWPRIIGLDFGWEHPTAVVWMAWDRDNDTTYLYHEHREKNARIPVIASAIRNRPDGWAPVVWPHDGLHHDKGSGKTYKALYEEEGLNMLQDCFSNPPISGEQEGKGNQSVEAGIAAMFKAMEEGRFKVFSTCDKWFEEKRSYHRRDGKIVKMYDDLISASRYAYMSLRFADTKPMVSAHKSSYRGLSNW